MRAKLGDRRIVDSRPRYLRAGEASILVECACGQRQWVRRTDWTSGRAGKRCKSCTAYAYTPGFLRRMQPVGARRLWVHFTADAEAQRLVEQHPDGLSVKAIARHYGCSRELVRLIERKAVAKLRDALQGAA